MKRSRRNDPARHAAWFGAVGSVLIHAGLSLLPVGVRPVAPVTGEGAERRPAHGTLVVSLPRDHPRTAPTPSAATVDAARATASTNPRPRTAAATPTDPGRKPASDSASTSPTSVATRLRPRSADWRLWRGRIGTRVSDDRWIVEEAAVGAEILADKRARSSGEQVDGMSGWYGTDRGGRRWGVSPGRLDVAGRVVPTCLAEGVNAVDCGFGAHPDARRSGLDGRISVHDAISRQAERAVVQELWSARARAIRERRDTERVDSAAVPR